VAYTQPTIANFKTRFDRDFAYAVDQTDMAKVRDADITIGLTQASANFNPNLFASQAVFTEAFLLLTAHFLCVNLLASSQGLGGSAQWLTSSKAVGNVSESFAVPERILHSPFLAALSKTVYGMTYLTIISPLLVGNVALQQGDTTI
jgi:hypothetical protein